MTFRDRVLAGELTVGVFVGLGSPVATEICGDAVDWVLIDLEHGSSTDADLLPQLHALSGVPAEPLVRVTGAVRTAVSKALDLGARGIMFPRIEGALDARAAIAMTRHPPAGVRGVAAAVRSSGFGSVSTARIGETSQGLLGIIQIETLGALDDCAAIAEVDGVDVLFVGPGDLSYALGAPGDRDHPAYQQAIERVVGAARQAGKVAGVLASDTRDAQRYLDAGFRFIAIGSDSAFLRRGVAEIAEWATSKRRAGGGSNQLLLR